MFDTRVRKFIDPVLNKVGHYLASRGVKADHVTIVSCIIGVCAAILISQQYFLTGLVFILISRAGDGFDGAIARASVKTDFGGLLDIVLDFVFYGAIPLGFAVALPSENALAAAFLIFSFYVNGASLLAYAAIAERKKRPETKRNEKAILFTTGLAEGTETIIFLCAFCLFPTYFPWLAGLFTVICLYTALSRLILAKQDFK